MSTPPTTRNNSANDAIKIPFSITSFSSNSSWIRFAQSETDSNKGLTIDYDAAGSPSLYTLRWWGRFGFYY